MTGFGDDGQPLTDEALLAAAVALRKAIREVQSGSGVGSISGEGRRVDFVKGNVGSAETELRELLAIARRRGLEWGGDNSGSIAVEFGR